MVILISTIREVRINGFYTISEEKKWSWTIFIHAVMGIIL